MTVAKLDIIMSNIKPASWQTFSSPPGSPQRYERCRDHRQAGPARPPPAQLVHPGHLRHQRGRLVRGPGLALQPAEEPEMIHSTSFVFCLLFIFSVSTQRQHRTQAPSLPSNPTSSPSSFFQELPSFPPSCFLPLVSTLGALACAACVCVCVWACMCVCVPCVFSECVWVWRRLCVCWLGLGVTLACLLHTSCGISSLVFKPLSPSTKLSLRPTQPTPTPSLARPPSPPPLLSRGSMVFIRQRKSKGASSPPPPSCSIYLC